MKKLNGRRGGVDVWHNHFARGSSAGTRPLCEALESRCLLTTYTWIATNAGAPNWLTATNWNPTGPITVGSTLSFASPSATVTTTGQRRARRQQLQPRLHIHRLRLARCPGRSFGTERSHNGEWQWPESDRPTARCVRRRDCVAGGELRGRDQHRGITGLELRHDVHAHGTGTASGALELDAF